MNILKKFNRSEANVATLKHMEAESRRNLHTLLDALLLSILDKAFKGEL